MFVYQIIIFFFFLNFHLCSKNSLFHSTVYYDFFLFSSVNSFIQEIAFGRLVKYKLSLLKFSCYFYLKNNFARGKINTLFMTREYFSLSFTFLHWYFAQLLLFHPYFHIHPFFFHFLSCILTNVFCLLHLIDNYLFVRYLRTRP